MKKNVNMNTLTGEEKQVKKTKMEDNTRKAGQKITKYNILKDKYPSYEFSDAGHMGAKSGLLQHRAENDHKE